MNTNGLQVDVTKLYDIADKIVDRYKAMLEHIDAKGTGALINSVSSDVQLRDQTVSLCLEVLDYYWQIEYGRKPSKSGGWQDPIGDLSTWIKSKIQRGKWMPKPGKPLPTTPKEIKGIAYPIYKSITKDGYERDWFNERPLQRTLDSSEDLLTQFADEVAQQIGEEVKAAWLDLNNISKAKGSNNTKPGNQQLRGK